MVGIGDEINRLGEWIFKSFSPAGVSLNSDQIECETQKMMKVTFLALLPGAEMCHTSSIWVDL